MVSLFSLVVTCSCLITHSVQSFTILNKIISLSSQSLQQSHHHNELDFVIDSTQRRGYDANYYENYSHDDNTINNIGNRLQNNGKQNNNHEHKKYDVLKFGGTASYISPPLPYPSRSDNKSIYDFFSVNTHQNILLTGGFYETTSNDILPQQNDDTQSKKENQIKNEVTKILYLNPSDYSYHDQLIRKWIDQCYLVGANTTDLCIDNAVLVKLDGIEMVGIKVFPTTIVGTKLFKNEEKWPQFQAVLIEDRPRAEGPRPLIWLFNKMVSGNTPSNNRDRDTSQSIQPDHSDTDSNRKQYALLKVWVEPSNDNDYSGSSTNGIISPDSQPCFHLHAEASLWIELKFPRILLRFFPMSKDKAEQVSSSAIIKVLNEQIVAAMETFLNVYMSWRQDNR